MLVGVNQKIAPIKFGFLIKPNSKNKLKIITETAFFLWNGIHSPIIPIYKKLPKSYKEKYGITLNILNYYKGILSNFSPDIIIYDDSLDIDFLNKFISNTPLLKLSDFNSKLYEGKSEYGIDVIEILQNLIKKEFKYQRNDNLNIAIHNLDKDNIFFNIFLGSLNPKIHKNITANLTSKNFFSTPNISNFADIKKISNSIGLLELNNYKLNSFSKRHWYRGEFIYFLKTNEIDDLINFWNLRALGCNVIPISIDDINHPYFTDLIKRFCLSKNEISLDFNIVNYLANNIDQDTKEKISNLINEIKLLIPKIQFAHQSWLPRFWEETRILEYDKVLCCSYIANSEYEQIESKENLIEFDVIKLPLEINKRKFKNKLSKVILDFNYFDNELEYAETIYGIDSKDWISLVYSFDGNKWNISKNGIEYFLNSSKEKIYFYIPKSFDFFSKYFKKNNYNIFETPNGRLAKEVFINLGGIIGLNLFSHKITHKAIELFENGKTINYSFLVGELKKNLKNKRIDYKFIIKKLLDNKIIEFGSRIKCSVCNQTSFYLLKELNNSIDCSICRNNFELELYTPSSIEWAYRGIGPFSKNNKVGGILSVFLTIKLFNREFGDSDGKITSLMEFEIKKDGITNEIDLAVLLKSKYGEDLPPDLIICECKTNKKLTIKDIDRLKKIGIDFPNSILVFCTLNETIDEEEKNLLIELVNFFRKGFGSRPKNPILILTANELIPEENYSCFSQYQSQIKSYHQDDYIGNLCELTVEKHLGLKTWGEIQTEIWKKQHQN
ncbi:MAG: hypothetical protein KBC58_06250 [Flavobacterium sp.]|nr:hypothetical protein [Flavobacterium sp.]